MEKKYTHTIGSLTYNEANGFFFGNVNGRHVTVNQIQTKEGKTIWIVKEELMLYEHAPKQQNQRPGGF